MARLVTRIAVAAGLIAGGIVFSATARADDPPNEQGFIESTSSLPMYVMPSRILTDENILAGGYRACAVMDQYPTESRTAAVVYFHGGNTVDGRITDDGWEFMKDAAIYLCDRHIAMWVGDG
jgi:serine/threonine-protein kinase